MKEKRLTDRRSASFAKGSLNEGKSDALRLQKPVSVTQPTKQQEKAQRENAETVLSLSLFESEEEAKADPAMGARTAPQAQESAGEVQLTRTLWEGETWLDSTTAQLISQLSGLRWPRRWSEIRRFETLAQSEIERIKREGREDSPFLQRKFRGGVEVIELSAKGEEALIAREGSRGFRRVIVGESGLSREYFIKRLVTSDGFVETRLSWFGAAWPLFEEASAKIERGFQAFLAKKDTAQKTLFEELDEAERERADARLRLMESVRNGRLVLDYLVRTFGRDAQNPIQIAAWDLRALLGCEKDPHGMRKVRGCLEALGEIRFEMAIKGDGQKARSFGALISEVQYVGAGRGDHGDGTFSIHLAPSALGCLAIFGMEKPELAAPQPRTVQPRTISQATLQQQQDFDWQKSLSPAELARLKKGYTRSQMALAPHYDRAHGLSATQSALLRWLEKELTLERDPSRVKRAIVTPGDRTPRSYSQLFCPALPSGRTFYGALGHFRDRPESGRKLATIAKELGLIWPSPRAKAAYRAAVVSLLEDLQLVIEEVLDGVVVICLPLPAETPKTGKARRGLEAWEWQRLGEKPHTPEFLAQNAAIFPFIAPEYITRLMTKLEAYYRARFERGESPFPVAVRHIKDRPQNPRSDTDQSTSLNTGPQNTISQTDTAPEIGATPATGTPLGTPSVTLAQRLFQTRKRLGLSQAEVAPFFGVSRVMVAKWERGVANGTTSGTTVPATPISKNCASKIEAWLRENET